MANTHAQTLIQAGLSKSMAYHVVNGIRSISIPLALWLFENDRIKVGPLSGKSASEIRTLRGMYEPAAPETVLARRAANDRPSQSKAA
jgi:hypothetical protein